MFENIIWNFLYGKIGNAYGVAGLMGNLFVESTLKSDYLQSTCAKKLGMTSAEYTQKTDDGSYQNFIHDSAGYGLAQWTYWSRKEALYNFAKAQGASIGDLSMQLVFLWNELQSYKTVINVLKTATSVKEASDIVVERYEKPKDQSDKAKDNRAAYGMKYFQKFAFIKKSKQVVVTADCVNIRLGNGKEFARISQANSLDSFDWIATAANGWHAIKFKKQVAWISGEFSKVE